jgi:hypothetical protein
MSLMDAPAYDEARERRNKSILIGSVLFLFVALIGYWLEAGRPIDYPWNWSNYMFGRATVNAFLGDIEKGDMAGAYGVWVHDKDWRQHEDKYHTYPFSRFEQDWSASSPDNEYGPIKSHQIALAGRYGNGVLIATLINERKSKALNLDYDPKSHTLDFAPPGVELYLGP